MLLRAITRTAPGALFAVAALLIGAGSAQAQVVPGPICQDPSAVPGQLLTSLDALVSFVPTPSEQTCAKIANTEVAGCNKSVQNAQKCNDTLNTARAKAKNAVCSTFVDPNEGAACLQDVQNELSALIAATKSAADAGLQDCADLSSAMVALCLGETF